MSAADREPLIREAADWLGRQHPHPSPIIPALRSRFGLTAKEAVDAIRLQPRQGGVPQ